MCHAYEGERAFLAAQERGNSRDVDAAELEIKRDAVAKALWEHDCDLNNEAEIAAGRKPPERWADPWHPSGCGVRQQQEYYRAADAVLAALDEPT